MESFPAAEPVREHQPLPSTTTSSLGPRLPQPPRRPHHTPPPRLNIHPVPELGPPIMQVQTTNYVNDILESKGIKIKWIHMHSFLQRQSGQSRRPSMSRAPQLTPGIGSMVCPAPPANINEFHISGFKVSLHWVSLQQHFFDDDDRMVPSTPTLVVPHRTDGFAEAIQWVLYIVFKAREGTHH